MRARLAIGLTTLCAACATPDAVPTPAPWPAADALFRSDPRWLGGDAVYSVDLGGERILWLFGDSFVATDARRDRRHSVMVRNTIAVQTGRDPAQATIGFHWRTDEQGRPSAFFADQVDQGFWPLHGIRLPNGPLLLFQTRVRNTPGQGLGFAIDGARLLCIDEPERDPQQWQWRELTLPALPAGCVVGTSVWRDGDWVVALGTRGNGPHRGVLARLRIADLRAAAPSLQWWDGTSWSVAPTTGPTTVLDDAGPECSIDRVPGGWRHVYSRGFGATTVAAHEAAAATGPWSAPHDLFTPPESCRKHPFVYAAKAHPALDAGAGRFAISYATNSFTFADLFTDEGQRELYWPTFWRAADSDSTPQDSGPHGVVLRRSPP